MLQITSPPSERIVAIRVSEQLTDKDVDTAIAAVEAALHNHDRVSFYAQVESSFRLTVAGFFKDLRYGFSKLRDLKRFYRAAVITDSRWIATIARVEGVVFSQIEIKVFPTSDREAAIQWASQSPPLESPREVRPAIRMIETDQPTVLAFEIDGHITTPDVKRVIERFQPVLETQEKIRVLGRFQHFDGFDFDAFMQDWIFALKSNVLRKVERYAVVGAPVWVENYIELFNPLVAIAMKCFSTESEDEAWAWLGARPIDESNSTGVEI